MGSRSNPSASKRSPTDRKLFILWLRSYACRYLDALTRRAIYAHDKKMTEAALTTEEQPYPAIEAAKTIAVFIKTAQNYRIVNQTWEACINFIDSTDQSENFTKLLEQFENANRQQILMFLDVNKKTVDAFVKSNNDLFSLLGRELVIGTRIFSGLLHEIRNDPNSMTLEKIDNLNDNADFVWKQSHTGLDAALRAHKISEMMENISKTMFDIYYQELFYSSEYNWCIMFDENGFISKKQRSAFLPAPKNS